MKTPAIPILYNIVRYSPKINKFIRDSYIIWVWFIAKLTPAMPSSQATLFKPMPILIEIPEAIEVRYYRHEWEVNTSKSNIKKYMNDKRPKIPQNNRKVNAEKKASSHRFICSL